MSVKYLYKNKKPIAQIWKPKLAQDTIGTAVVAGALVVTSIAVVYVLWNIQSLQQKKAKALSTCHTCGQR